MRIALLLLLFCFTLNAQLALNNAFYNQFIGKRVMATNDYFFQEFFEAPGYENTWTTNGTGGTINPDNSSSPLQGSYSFSISLSTDNVGVRSTFTAGAKTTIHGFFMFRFSNKPGTGGDEDFIALNSSGSKVLYVFLAGGDTLKVATGLSGADQATTVDTVANNTTYYCWWSYIAGSGANGFFSIAFSTTPIKPTSGDGYAEYTTSLATSSVNQIRIGGDTLPGTDSWAARYDAILFSDTPIGSNPF